MGIITKKLTYFLEREDGHKIYSHTQDINFDDEKLKAGFYQPIENAIENAIIPNKILLDNEILILSNDGITFEVKQDYSDIIYYSKIDRTEKKYSFLEIPDTTIYTDKKPIDNEQFQIFNESLNKWVIDTQAKIDFIKTQKLNELDSEHEKFKTSYKSKVLAIGYYWDSGIVYQTNIESAIKEFDKGTIENITWLDYDNYPHLLTKNNLQSILDKIETDLFITGQNSYQKRWIYKTQINNLYSNGDVDTLGNLKFNFEAV